MAVVLEHRYGSPIQTPPKPQACGEMEGEKGKLGLWGGGRRSQPCPGVSSPAPDETLPLPTQQLSLKASKMTSPPGVLQGCGESWILQPPSSLLCRFSGDRDMEEVSKGDSGSSSAKEKLFVETVSVLFICPHVHFQLWAPLAVTLKSLPHRFPYSLPLSKQEGPPSTSLLFSLGFFTLDGFVERQPALAAVRVGWGDRKEVSGSVLLT